MNKQLAEKIYERLILNGANLGTISILIIQDELDESLDDWILNYPELPEDEKFYDIKLQDGTIIERVEFWAFGGGWKPTKRNEGTTNLVHYPYKEVYAYRKGRNAQSNSRKD